MKINIEIIINKYYFLYKLKKLVMYVFFVKLYKQTRI